MSYPRRSGRCSYLVTSDHGSHVLAYPRLKSWCNTISCTVFFIAIRMFFFHSIHYGLKIPIRDQQNQETYNSSILLPPACCEAGVRLVEFLTNAHVSCRFIAVVPWGTTLMSLFFSYFFYQKIAISVSHLTVRFVFFVSALVSFVSRFHQYL